MSQSKVTFKDTDRTIKYKRNKQHTKERQYIWEQTSQWKPYRPGDSGMTQSPEEKNFFARIVHSVKILQT